MHEGFRCVVLTFSTVVFSAVLLAATDSGAGSDRWVQDDLGQTAIFRMAGAPYPHKSRDEGFKIDGQVFPREPHYTDNSVAIFIPRGYQPRERTDLLIYFHGHYNSVRNAMREFKLREQVLAAGKNVIFVFPEGPKDAGDSGGGRLEERDGLKALVTEVLDVLGKEGKIPNRELGRVLLAGHSGAYRVISFCLERGGLEDHVSAACLLDASYDRWDAFVDWAVRNPSHRLFSVFTDHLSAENVYMMTQLRKKSTAYDLLDDADATDAVLGGQRVLFLHAASLKHNQTVQWLQRWLQSVPMPVRRPVARRTPGDAGGIPCSKKRSPGRVPRGLVAEHQVSRV